jgi:tRNA-dihydrouridine synthase A
MVARSSQVASGALPAELATRVSLAPMMQRTDRHFRYMLRLLAPDVRLYTEMITAQALAHGAPERLLAFDPAEHPVALQLGGSDPDLLAQAARLGADAGYDEINLNIGCPSDRVSSGEFGACLMAKPDRVAECVAAMNAVVAVPVSVKIRCGIDDQDSYEFVENFIATVASADCRYFIVHARKAILSGLSPKENRNIPPLRYPLVYRLAATFPKLRMSINGGIRTVAAASEHLEHVDGVMIGRQAYSEPFFMARLQQAVLSPEAGRASELPARADVVRAMAEYADAQLGQGVRLHQITRHMLGLYAGQPGARHWRRYLSERTRDKNSGADVLLDSLREVNASD